MILIVIHFGQAASTLPLRTAWHRLGATLIQYTLHNWRPTKICGIGSSLTEAIDSYPNFLDMSEVD